ncbi:uncharacterized protein HMPREF1541_10065 [Cyphellophora europaea CBS 101466]|uniref:Uncharacterized protein n=1 Tax=Cyphellophora europaea (strain CBS 101466) TaxID=1220924 RepID=W2SAY3_CYPE1|nr:uncharacterized protein HMPREF1541_10065 [Cyphellophora europaea CBS 101466]ETN45188.1 hypothetical protein HMPREF1541_10065 [Cyphellophora europaea CBS 101466]
MSAFFYSGHQQHHHPQAMHHNPQPHNHHGRSRRAPRLPASHNRHYRQQKPQKEVVVSENPNLTAFRARFEAGRSFDLDDDLEFCPNLLTFDEKQSVSSGSDRSSLSSGSPESSPLQHQIQPDQITPALSLSATTSAYVSPSFHNNTLKVHQPSAIRSGTKAIPIVNPSTGIRIASPPSSISPGMMQMSAGRW